MLGVAASHEQKRFSWSIQRPKSFILEKPFVSDQPSKRSPPPSLLLISARLSLRATLAASRLSHASAQCLARAFCWCRELAAEIAGSEAQLRKILTSKVR